MIVQGDEGIDALLVGYEKQENLGLRSIRAYLQRYGRRVALTPFFPGHESLIIAAVEEYRPRLIGFSVIFQYTLEEFGNLMQDLRGSGIRSHFTAGGHFPSLRPVETLELIPELDSIVRFEGEETVSELLEFLDRPHQWKHIRGLAFRRGDEIVVNEPRPLISDLDSLPPVYRDEPGLTGVGVKMAHLAASRGCLYNCSFCSIRQFYGSASGALRRTRSPQAVVDEMLALFTEKEVRYFSFQDDDFAAKTPRQRQWLQAFFQGLAKAGLADQVRWKISCRVDDLEPEIFTEMSDHGLMAVYLGVESGNEVGLDTLNKKVSVAQNLAAIDLLKHHRVAMSIGFMLFDPSSTLETVRENINFLQKVGEDGYFPINFCKMLPYAGTPIEARLRQEGRLRGTMTRPDYGYLDPKLDWYEFLVNRIFTKRNFCPDGLVMLLQEADFNFHLSRAFDNEELPDAYGTAIRQLTSRSNRLALQTLSTLLDELIFHGIDHLLEERETLVELAERQWRGDMEIEVELKKLNMNAFPNEKIANLMEERTPSFQA